ncbi:Poly(A) polymerase [Dissulfuribacter thermophilus]|uniref:Poly(A) polymerase n=1 Tax=Dissulfuribacter thermophilus TaxID=1156395 RepID=A0A1B9F957_9BACT|nr:hypothetical protein [Dissulfuribacter thermophilus]OCC16447.1 Poly(A) polymerase [Dissulfuribacter thermophilus]
MLRESILNAGLPTPRQKRLFKEFGHSPKIIPRPKHCISRKAMDREALKVLYRLKEKGYLAYLVGGSVRDLLLGKRPKDFDIGTNARPHEIRRIFRYSRIIGKRFRIVHVYFKGGKIIEVSTFRRQSDCDDREALLNGKSDDEIYGTPMEDAFRRDLTINGLFYNIADFSIIDYVGGMEDLEQGIIRSIGEPNHRFLRDPVRMMRAVRHAARTGFVIEKKTWEAICQNASKIRLCSIPRVRDEWLKDIKSGFSRQWMEYLIKSGLFEAIFPVYSSLILNGPSSIKRLLYGLLDTLDQKIRSGEEPKEALRLAMFLYPALKAHPMWEGLRSEKLKWPTFEVRSIIDELVQPYDFRRAVRDETAQILSSQWPLGLCHARGRLPKRVWSKHVFKDALFLYNKIREIEGKEIFEVRLKQNGTPKKNKKDRGKKRKNRQYSKIGR